MSDSMFEFKPTTTGLRSQRVSEGEENPRSPEVAEQPEEVQRKKLTAEEKALRRAERKLRQKQLRKNLRGFLEEAAEESDDEELASFTRKRRRSEDGDEDGLSDSSDSDAADLADLVASEDEERKLKGRAEKDKRKLAKLHVEWADERDKELEDRIEKGDFRKRRKMEIWGEGENEGGGMTRRERMRRAKYDSNGERILSSDSEESEEDEEDWLTEEEDEWKTSEDREETKRKERKKKEVIKSISEQKILRQKNLNILGLQDNEKAQYEQSVKEVNVFGVEKTSAASTRNSTPFFKFLTDKNHQSLGFR
jgi:hypothetical protein